MEYVIATLVGLHKLYAMPKFFEHIGKLDVLPKEIIISTTDEIFSKCFDVYNLDIPLVHVHGPNDLGNDMIDSTTSAREAIRLYILDTRYEWCLWLDNDILVPPDMISRFSTLRFKYPYVRWFYGWHPNRKYGYGGDHKFSTGMGDSFVHRKLCSVPFTSVSIGDRTLGDDYIWIRNILDLTRWDVFNPVLQGPIFNVQHLREDGNIVSLDSYDLTEL